MLELRPCCECCGRDLPPDAPDARICSYECTFCVACVELLENVCPNCGGGFTARPIRPAKNWKDENCLAAHPATATITHRPVNLDDHKRFAAALRTIPPHLR